jgi:hypothetical protein
MGKLKPHLSFKPVIIYSLVERSKNDPGKSGL